MSGNRAGRPKGQSRVRTQAIDIILEKRFTVRENGVERELTTKEALMERTLQEALKGKRRALREVLKWVNERDRFLAKETEGAKSPAITIRCISDPGNANEALLLLDIAEKDPRWDHHDDRTRVWLKPWAVQMAFDRRRGGDPLTEEDIVSIERCTAGAETLRWPKRYD